MERSKPLIIVLSRNYSTGLGVIRSLGAAGYTVDLIASTKKKGSSVIASSSKYVRNSVEVVTSKIQGDTGDKLLEEIMKYSKYEKGNMVLFPVDDFTTSVIDLNREILKPYFYMPEIVGGSNNSICKIMNKIVQTKLAEEAGLLIPKEWVISLKEELSIPNDIIYPCFVKPLQSITGQKKEMKVCQNENELKGQLSKMQSFFCEREVLIQEYLTIDKEFDLSGVSIDQEIIIPAVIEKTKIATYELGVTMCGKLQPVEILGDVKEKIIKLLKSIHYVGMFDMELYLCGDKIYFNEINFRSGGPNYSYYLNGVNLPAIFVKEIIGQKHNPEEEKMEKFGQTFVYEKVAWEDFIHFHITKQELDQLLKNADYVLLNDKSDPKPGDYFNKRIRLSLIKKRLKNMMEKKKNISRKSEKKESSDKKSRNIIVAGRNYCNILTMVRALGEAGYEVDVVRIYKNIPRKINILAQMEPEAHSMYVKGFYRCVVNNNPENVLKQLIELADKNELKLIMPVDDYTACIVDRGYHELSKYFIVPNIAKKSGEIIRLMDKNMQKGLAACFDIPMLSSVVVKSKNGDFNLPETIKYPCYIKPNISINSTKAKMVKCCNRDELKEILFKYAKKEDFEMLVEEFVDIKSEYSLLGLSTPDSIIAPALFKVLEGGHRERKGVSIAGEVVDNEPFEKIIEKCCSYVKSLNYTGLFDIDLIEASDGRIYFIELNFRAGASMHLFTKLGINLPGVFSDCLLKSCSVSEVSTKTSIGKRFVSEKVLLEEYVRNDVKLQKVCKLFKEADVRFIQDEKDKQPYRYFCKFYFIVLLMKPFYWIRDYRFNKER